jgi:hypothetical protein
LRGAEDLRKTKRRRARERQLMELSAIHGRQLTATLP